MERSGVVAKFSTTAKHGAIEGKSQTHLVDYYNLDVVISIGYRVKSLEGVRFREWATARIKEYIIKGYTMDDERRKYYIDKLLDYMLPYILYSQLYSNI